MGGIILILTINCSYIRPTAEHWSPTRRQYSTWRNSAISQVIEELHGDKVCLSTCLHGVAITKDPGSTPSRINVEQPFQHCFGFKCL